LIHLRSAFGFPKISEKIIYSFNVDGFFIFDFTAKAMLLKVASFLSSDASKKI